MNKEKEVFEKEALIYLLQKGYVFPIWDKNEDGTRICINCNDLFVIGCADLEPLPYDEIINLYKGVINETDKGWFVDKWVCKRRNLQPCYSVIERMKTDGVWDDEMEKLNVNNYK